MRHVASCVHELGADHLIFDGVGERGIGRDFHNSLTDIKRCIARYFFLSVCSCAIFLKFKCPIFLGILHHPPPPPPTAH